MAESRTNSGLAGELLVELRRDGPVPLHRQIEASIRGAAGPAGPANRTADRASDRAGVGFASGPTATWVYPPDRLVRYPSATSCWYASTTTPRDSPRSCASALVDGITVSARSIVVIEGSLRSDLVSGSCP